MAGVPFSIVWHGDMASLEEETYPNVIGWAAQTMLRQTMGKMTLPEILSVWAMMDEPLRKIIDERTPSGV
jgi:regulator of protease activity HflC (stomatin/prohibitin superfamily)